MKHKDMKKRTYHAEWQSGVKGITYSKAHGSWKVNHRDANGKTTFLGTRVSLDIAKMLLIGYERRHGVSTVGEGLVGRDAKRKKVAYTKEQKRLRNELWKLLI